MEFNSGFKGLIFVLCSVPDGQYVKLYSATRKALTQKVTDTFCYILLSHATNYSVVTHYYYFDKWVLLPFGEKIFLIYVKYKFTNAVFCCETRNYVRYHGKVTSSC